MSIRHATKISGFSKQNYFQKIFGQSQSGHITSIHLTGDVSTMCFTLTRNYSMKTSLQQQESFVIRVGLSP